MHVFKDQFELLSQVDPFYLLFPQVDGPTRGDRIANGRNPRAGNDELRQRNGGRSSEDLRNGGRSSEDLRNGRRSSEDLRNGERSRQNSGRLNGSGSDDMINEHFYDVPEVGVCVPKF